MAQVCSRARGFRLRAECAEVSAPCSKVSGKRSVGPGLGFEI